MYLTANLYTSKYSNPEYADQIKKVKEILPEIFDGNDLSVEISFKAGYWRKANQIHKWFVDNVQDGKDECHPHDVSRKELEKLKKACETVLKILSEQKLQSVTLKDRYSKEDYKHDVYVDTEEIEEILPNTSGFFFGGTQYDEYYKVDLESTIEIIDECLKLPEAWNFEYRSSW